jgi:SAM-dependent methyltransferase
MDHADHVRLIRDGVSGAGPSWADLGSGGGAFTLALADLLGSGGRIVSVDRDIGALTGQARLLAERCPRVTLDVRVADFTRPLGLAGLDGVVMANSLHFARDKAPVLALVRGYLRRGGRLVIVEYDTDRGNPWVPFPIFAARWPALAAEARFRGTRRLASVPSRFLGSIYSAVSER